MSQNRVSDRNYTINPKSGEVARNVRLTPPEMMFMSLIRESGHYNTIWDVRTGFWSNYTQIWSIGSEKYRFFII